MAATRSPTSMRASPNSRSRAAHRLDTLQSNAEHVLIERIHAAKGEGVGYIVFNPGAFTHTSIALRDALLGVGIPFIEVHLSNVHAREDFRQHSYLSDVARGVITGLGAKGYEYALTLCDGRAGSVTPMDLRKIKKLIDMVEESGISELEVRNGEETIRISRPLAPEERRR